MFLGDAAAHTGNLHRVYRLPRQMCKKDSIYSCSPLTPLTAALPFVMSAPVVAREMHVMLPASAVLAQADLPKALNTTHT